MSVQLFMNTVTTPNSSVVSSFTYLPGLHAVDVTLNTGNVYRYFDVNPTTWTNLHVYLTNGNSAGRAYNTLKFHRRFTGISVKVKTTTVLKRLANLGIEAEQSASSKQWFAIDSNLDDILSFPSLQRLAAYYDVLNTGLTEYVSA